MSNESGELNHFVYIYRDHSWEQAPEFRRTVNFTLQQMTPHHTYSLVREFGFEPKLIESRSMRLPGYHIP